jgi:hypothetical protein
MIVVVVMMVVVIAAHGAKDRRNGPVLSSLRCSAIGPIFVTPFVRYDQAKISFGDTP